MKTTLVLALSYLLPLFLFAGNSPSLPELREKIVYPDDVAHLNIEDATTLTLDLPAGFNLTPYFSIESKTAIHHHYTVDYNGDMVFGSEVHAVVSKAGKLLKIIYNEIPLNISENTDATANKDEILLLEKEAEEILLSKAIWAPLGNTLIKARLVELSTENAFHKQLIYTDTEILYEVEKIKRHHMHGPNDTLAVGFVFDPDPLTTAGVNYGSPYLDASDSDVPELNAQRKTRNILISYQLGLFTLENDFVKIVDVSPPSNTPVTRLDDQFFYTRSESGFEDVNALYHITHFNQHLVALGFNNIPGYQINVDPHALGNDDNSMFVTSTTPPRILFGEGNVDDAEDADVVIHEFTHACILAASGNNNGSLERNTMEEALGDYFAASYSASVSNFNKDQVFNWDGHNAFWQGRNASSNKDYQQLTFSDIYQHTDIWVSCLMEINSVIGRNASDEIVMEAIFNLGQNTTMPQMAVNILEADSALNGGVNHFTIATAFVRRNILDQSYLSEREAYKLDQNLSLVNTLDFSEGGELQLIAKNKALVTRIGLYDMSGTPVLVKEFNGGSTEVRLSSGSLSSGVYILSASLQDGSKESYKVVKY